ncbi:MAG: hypothetical protein Q9220_003622 [cf. Caloplaca sp. 1 TL-2023]
MAGNRKYHPSIGQGRGNGGSSTSSTGSSNVANSAIYLSSIGQGRGKSGSSTSSTDDPSDQGSVNTASFPTHESISKEEQRNRNEQERALGSADTMPPSSSPQQQSLVPSPPTTNGYDSLKAYLKDAMDLEMLRHDLQAERSSNNWTKIVIEYCHNAAATKNKDGGLELVMTEAFVIARAYERVDVGEILDKLKGNEGALFALAEVLIFGMRVQGRGRG